MHKILVAATAIAFTLIHPSFASVEIANRCGPNGALVGGSSCELRIRGQISAGDADHIDRVISTSQYEVAIATFESPGGDPFEALKIADVLNKYFIPFATGICADECSPVCASACALIYLAANTRFGNEVYLHRPTFPAALFGPLSASKAQAIYNVTTNRLRAELEQRGVQKTDIELMMSIPSDDLRRVRDGFPSNSPWMEEWLAAKCGTTMAPNIDPKVLICESDVQATEQRRAQHKVQ